MSHIFKFCFYIKFSRSRSKILALQGFHALDAVQNSLSFTTQTSFNDFSLKRKHPNRLEPISHTKKSKIKPEGKFYFYYADMILLIKIYFHI